jgi:hypothetical protein
LKFADLKYLIDQSLWTYERGFCNFYWKYYLLMFIFEVLIDSSHFILKVMTCLAWLIHNINFFVHTTGKVAVRRDNSGARWSYFWRDFASWIDKTYLSSSNLNISTLLVFHFDLSYSDFCALVFKTLWDTNEPNSE